MIRLVLNKTGKKLNVTHLRAFGCVCYMHNNDKDSLGRFDAKSDKGIFFGYSSPSKSYKVFNKRAKYVEESAHIIFDEANSMAEKVLQE